MLSSFRFPLGYVAIALMGCLLWASCDDVEPCTGCSSEINSSFEDQLYKVIFADVDTFLLDHDADATTVHVFKPCSAQLLRAFENDNIVQVSGSFRNMCRSGGQLIAIDEVQRVTTCLPAIPQLEGPYSLNNSWFIEYIQTPDTTVITPCGSTSFVTFNTTANRIDASIEVNWLTGNYELINDSTMRMPVEFWTSAASSNNSSQRFFHGLFNEVIEGRSIITFKIQRNVLTLTNTADNSSIRLFLTQ